MCQDPLSTSYDELPYPGHAFPQTHPDRLATVATLFGLKPPPVQRCRVLELGCAAGANLIPLALALPDSTFVGIDLSGQQVTEAVRTVQALGLKNIDCRHASILDVDESYGVFDYIICHGVYSWVPAAVQDKILDLCRHNLAPNGVGYISYNTYPGWHLRGLIRDMMNYHCGRAPLRDHSPRARVGEARALLDFLARSCRQAEGPYGLQLKQELELLRQHSDSYLFHEHLEEFNEPLYFHEFHERLTAKGLRYLGEADFNTMVPAAFPADVQQVLHGLAPDLVRMEQYLDFLRNRTFRQTLLCHAQQRPNYTLHPEQLTVFHVASPLKAHSPRPELDTSSAEMFQGAGDVSLTVTQPIVKAALLCLSERWPRALAFAELRDEARARLGPALGDREADTRELGGALLTAYAGGATKLVELSLCPPRFASIPGERPEVSPLARLQALSNPEVTNLRHQRVTLPEFDRQCLPYLDGRHTRSEQLEVLLARFGQKRLSLERNGQPIRATHEARPILAETLDRQLSRLAGAALLMP